MKVPVHFYMTFNPYLNSYLEKDYTQAHEFYDYLKSEVKKSKDAYAYWGKMIGNNRESKVDFSKLNEVLEVNKKNGVSTHLYITDFNNLWVGKVESVHEGIGKDFKTLNFYKEKKVEVWFKLSDFTLLEYYPEATASKLSELYIDNDYMGLEIDGLSPFTSAIKYPAFVQDLAEEQYFDEKEDGVTHLIMQDHPAINSTGTSKVMRGLHSYALPESVYSKIPHAAKLEIETAELDMIEQRQHNINKVAFSYIKSLEIIMNYLVIHHMKKEGLGDDFFVNPHTMPPKLYLDDREEGVVPISQFHKNYSINQLIYLVQRAVKSNRLDFSRAFKNRKGFLKYVCEKLPKRLEESQMMDIRGILAHSDSAEISEHDALAMRNIILGVGCKGIIHELYQAFYKETLEPICKIQGNYQKKHSEAAPRKRKLKIA